MSKVYNKHQFSIDLVMNHYDTKDANEIRERCYSLFSEDISESEIKDYLGLTFDFEKKSRIIEQEIFEKL